MKNLPRDPRASLIVILYPNRHRLMIECGHFLVGLRLRGRAPIHTSCSDSLSTRPRVRATRISAGCRHVIRDHHHGMSSVTSELGFVSADHHTWSSDARFAAELPCAPTPNAFPHRSPRVREGLDGSGEPPEGFSRSSRACSVATAARRSASVGPWGRGARSPSTQIGRAHV
jgi:hypothetical protein